MRNKASILALFIWAVLYILSSNLCSCERPSKVVPIQLKDTLNVTYTNAIAQILSNDCTKCHKTGNTSGYVNLDSYENAKPYGLNGNLYGCVQHLDGNVSMPIGAPKLDSTNLLLIKRWCILKCPL